VTIFSTPAAIGFHVFSIVIPASISMGVEYHKKIPVSSKKFLPEY
jgi:hypothetical protein